MKNLKGDHTGCSVLIYDADGNHLDSTFITNYDKTSLRMEIQRIHPELNAGSICKVMILTAPSPFEYHGRVKSDATGTYIALYLGQERENRGSERYKLSTTAMIENLICDGRAYPLYSPLEVNLVNISKSGVRFRSPFNSFSIGDRFQMRMKISETDKLLITVVVNKADIGTEASEYGCQFLIASSGR